jgi:glycosyltransferase involved in cell wall biosynthesis
LHQKKGLEILIDALSNLPDEVHLLIAGSGERDYVAQIRQQIDHLSLSERVTLTGYLDGNDKSLALAGADLFTLISHSENFGVAVLEALAHGTSVLVSPGVALSSQVRSHGLGAVAAMEVADVAVKLRGLVADKAELEELGERGRRYVAAEHGWPTLANDLKSMYREIVERERRKDK